MRHLTHAVLSLFCAICRAKVDAKGRGPTARSGHRMAVHGDRIFLFGGFSDFVKESKYYNDLFVFDIENVMWNEVTLGVGALRPPSRTNCITLASQMKPEAQDSPARTNRI